MSVGNFAPTRCNAKGCRKIQKEGGDFDSDR